MSVKQKVLVQHLGTDTGSSGPHWGQKEQTMFVHVPLMTGTMLSHNHRILPLGVIPLHMSRLMAVITCHQSCLACSLNLALALIAAAPPLKLLWSRSPLLLPRARRKLALLPLPTITRYHPHPGCSLRHQSHSLIRATVG